MIPLRFLLFILASAGLGRASRRALARPRTHGRGRFWAWEAILALVFLQAPAWFRKPFRARPNGVLSRNHGLTGHQGEPATLNCGAGGFVMNEVGECASP